MIKRMSVLFVIVLIALTACGPSPKKRSDEFGKYIPAEIGEWERKDNRTLTLGSSTVSNQGHITYEYEGPNDAIAYIVIDAYPSTNAAEIASNNRQRDLMMKELKLDADRAPKKVTAQLAQSESGMVRYALMQENEIVVEINVIAADGEDPISDEVFSPLVDTVRTAFAKVAE